MNQPKFKFGDRVKRIDGKYGDFIVRSINWEDRTNAYYYAGYGLTLSEIEKELELYQKPQKKKLYAIQNIGTGLIEFTLNECPVNYRHVSEYDIEYPEGK